MDFWKSVDTQKKQLNIGVKHRWVLAMYVVSPVSAQDSAETAVVMMYSIKGITQSIEQFMMEKGVCNVLVLV